MHQLDKIALPLLFIPLNVFFKNGSLTVANK
jgi:hypothetical protein